MLKTPIALIIFKRADTTKRVIEAIRQAAPEDLYVIADGGRSPEEHRVCEETRRIVEESVDWPCQIHKSYSDINLGSKKRIVSGLDWVFKNVERAIILEDDTVPDPTFFLFAEELLERYEDEPKVMQIAGINFQQKNKAFDTGGASYYFSRFPEIWGWATWRRAWNLFDASMEKWPEARESNLLARLMSPAAADYWQHLFDHIHAAGDDRKKSDVWAAQWVFACLLKEGFSVNPRTNLVTNIGTDSSRTSKGSKGADLVNLPIVPMPFPLTHPQAVSVNAQADEFSLYQGWKIKNTVQEKILFFLKLRFPTAHLLIKSIAKRA